MYYSSRFISIAFRRISCHQRIRRFSQTQRVVSAKPIHENMFLNLETSHAAKSDTEISSQTLEKMLSEERFVQTAQSHDDHMTVTWSDGSDSEYPYVWMRDNCRCKTCYSPSSSSRLLAMNDLNINIKPRTLTVKNGSVEVTWSDGHLSLYTSTWLYSHDFTDSVRDKRLSTLSPVTRQLWAADLQDNIPTFTFGKLMTCEKTLYEWITSLERTGLTLVRDSPCVEGEVAKIGDRVGLETLCQNHYGKVLTVKAELNPSNLASSSAALGFHLDLPYYYYAPGMEMFHCIKQIPRGGGENQLVDGFYIANLLKEQEPEMFDILSKTLVDFQDIGVDKTTFFKLTRKPTIQCDLEGNIQTINYNNMMRSSHLHLPRDKVNILYQAMKTFNSLMYKPDNHINYKLQPGDIMCVDNHRVLHGRHGYRLLPGEDRHLENGYINWDELHSRRRVLLIQLGLIQPL